MPTTFTKRHTVGMQWVIHIVYSELHLMLSHFASRLFQSLGANITACIALTAPTPNRISQNRTFLHKPTMCCIHKPAKDGLWELKSDLIFN